MHTKIVADRELDEFRDLFGEYSNETSSFLTPAIKVGEFTSSSTFSCDSKQCKFLISLSESSSWSRGSVVCLFVWEDKLIVLAKWEPVLLALGQEMEYDLH